jgi:hypothetical protein
VPPPIGSGSQAAQPGVAAPPSSNASAQTNRRLW